jgi:hypothetical protein
MAFTYRFDMRAERSDGQWVTVLQSAAVYNTLEEALMQAGADHMIGANMHPVDVIAGAHHGYEVTAYGEVVDDGDETSVRRRAAWKQPKVLAEAEQIEAAAGIVHELWGHPDDDSALAPGPLAPFLVPDQEETPERKSARERALAEHEERSEETLRRLREVTA